MKLDALVIPLYNQLTAAGINVLSSLLQRCLRSRENEEKQMPMMLTGLLSTLPMAVIIWSILCMAIFPDVFLYAINFSS